MATLTKETKQNIEMMVGRPFNEVCDLISGTDIGVDVKFSHAQPFVVARGNPYLAEMRYTTIDEADKRMLKLIRETRRGRKTTK